jgi:hypothetical protein
MPCGLQHTEVCRSLHLDKTIRSLRESPLEDVDASSVQSLVQQCAIQQENYARRKHEGNYAAISWLAGSTWSEIGDDTSSLMSVMQGQVHGLSSLGERCLDTASCAGTVQSAAGSVGGE